jgi:hypothetical protein
MGELDSRAPTVSGGNTMRRSAILACLFALVLGGCGHDDDPFFDVRVTMINNGAPVQADLCILDDSVLPPVCGGASEDFVPVRMINKARSNLAVTDPNTFLHDFQLQRYSVSWRRVDGGPSSDPAAGWSISDHDFEAGTSVVVPVGGFADFAIMISPAGMKFGQPFDSALMLGDEILLIADIDFVGTRGITSDVEIHVPASLSVNFANFEDL